VHPVDSIIHDLAAGQLGVFSREQALGAGASPNLIRARVDRGRWEVPAPGVLALPGHAPTFRRSLWIAVLHGGPGSTVSHEAAGVIREVEGVRSAGPVVSVPRPRSHPWPGARWHRLDDHVGGDVEQVRGLPVTSLVRTLVDLAAVYRQARYDTIVESEVVSGRVTVAALGDRLQRIRRRGKPGVARLSTTLDLLGPGADLEGTALERLLDRVIALAGLPTPVKEHPLPSARGLVGFVDRWFPDAGLIVEADGRRWHARRAQMARDRERDVEVARLGIQTLRFVWEHLDHAPLMAADDLRVVYDTRLHLLADR
jgi:hypothetical protein